MDTEEDHRIHEEICGITHIGSTGIEWVCIKKPHEEVKKRKDGKGYYSVGVVDAHYMVPRYPHRVKFEEDNA